MSFPSESLRLAYPCETMRMPSPSHILFFLLVILRQRTEYLASAGSSDGLSGDSQTVSEEFPSWSGCCGDTFNRFVGRSDTGSWICCGVDPGGLVSNGDLNGLYILCSIESHCPAIDQVRHWWLQKLTKDETCGGRRVVDARPLPTTSLIAPSRFVQPNFDSLLHEHEDASCRAGGQFSQTVWPKCSAEKPLDRHHA